MTKYIKGKSSDDHFSNTNGDTFNQLRNGAKLN